MSRRIALLGVALSAGLLLPPGTAWAAQTVPAGRPNFGPVSSGIFPGVQSRTVKTFCTVNFVFTDAAADVYFGQAAHCSRTRAEEGGRGTERLHLRARARSAPR